VKKFPAFYGTLSFITVFTGAREQWTACKCFWRHGQWHIISSGLQALMNTVMNG